MADSTSSAVWNGGLSDGHGAMIIGERTAEVPFSAGSRFEGQAGSNPEELVGAALAGCFSMAPAKNLQDAGARPDRIETRATVSLEKMAGGFAVTRIMLRTEGSVAREMSEDEFKRLAGETKKTCPMAKVLANADIRLEASLV